MGDLEMEPAMQKGEGIRADNICCRPKLTMRERFLRSKVGCGASEMGEDDLCTSVSQLFVLHHEVWTVPEHAEGSGLCS